MSQVRAKRSESAWVHRSLLPIAAIYGWAARTRAGLYERGWLPRKKLPCRVISVGNLTVGGTGKTPIVIWIVEQLLAAGKRVAVLSRGYRRRGSSPMLLVSDGVGLLADPGEAGDEPYLMARRCPAAVVAVGADRYRLGRWVLDRFPVDCCVLDDGFQHMTLIRDVNLLLVDASDPDGLDSMLPAGRLREPLSAAGRASAVLVTRAARGADAARILQVLKPYLDPRLPTGLARFRAERFVEMRTGAWKRPEEMAGQTAVAFSGIGNASSFRGLLEHNGLKILDEIIFPDHHDYTSHDIEMIRGAAARHGVHLIVTTEKDAVKVEPLMGPEGRFWAVRLGTEIVEGREQLEHLILGNDA
jgi:tetraacyldisaccharide 4'-kinase